MNYYERYMGDYQGKTQFLSLAEHGAYTMLLDAYYMTEKPLPADYKALYRLCRAMDKAEQEAVRSVADQFFPVGDDGLRHNERADVEIGRARQRMEAARSNGKKGGRPRKGSETETQNETQEKPNGFPLGSETETQNEPRSKAPHTPYPIDTSPTSVPRSERYHSEQREGERAPLDGKGPGGDPDVPIAPNVAIAVRLRELGVSITPSNPHAIAWAEAGATPETVAEAVQVARDRKGETARIPPGYLDPIIRDLLTPKPARPSGARQAGASAKPSSHSGFESRDYTAGIDPATGRF